MPYMTIVLKLLMERTELYEELRQSRRLLPTVEAFALDLKASHESWQKTLAKTKTGVDPIQIASLAMELALVDLADHLPCEPQPDESEPLSLDQAMAFVSRHSPNG